LVVDLLIGDVFRNAARAVPERAAVALGSEALTFGEIDRRSNGIAHSLAGLGVGRGDRVVVWSATSLEVVAVFAALAKLGAVFVPMNPGLSVEEASVLVAAARPVLMVMDGGRVSAAGEFGVPVTMLGDLGSGSDLRDVRAERLSERDPHVVFFTSGSSGRPKGVVLSHRVNFLRTHPGALLEPRGAMVCSYPLFHMAAWTIALQQWQARDLVVFVGSADAASICEAVERDRATRLNCIPGVWRRVLEYLDGGAACDLSSLRFADTGTSATPLSLLSAIEAALPGATIRVFYGSTEAGSVASLFHEDFRRKPGSVGVPAPSVSVRIDDAGELWVHGPLLFDGYFDDPVATMSSLVDGWYLTGDLAEVDAEGYLTIVGRAGDVIRTGGESVTPGEVEAVLIGHPSVADVAVVGIPDERWGEIVCAVVVPVDVSAPATIEDVRAFCEGRLAPFKHPRKVAIVESIPRTPATNQVQRRLLVESLS
jgi:acyl-CoA synthetase (AMP-forming)/AMP-acid ligase II